MIILYRIYQLLIMVPLMLIATAIAAVITSCGCMLFGGRWWGYYPPMLWARIMCALTLVCVKVSGREHITSRQSYVFVANHQGAYDIFAIYGYLGHNFRWMMKQSLERIPLVGWACKKAGMVFVDSRTPAAIAKTMHNAENLLAHGMSLVVFPEGARTFTGEVGRFKRGAYTLATGYNLPVVPITIDGAFHVMPRTTKIPRFGTIKLTIHAPISPSDPNLIEDSRNAILSVL
ncbi:MAG: 1-acyl-sn-glycerol-3-phosphate acyltransferase [Bacteroides sp.]|nr:1-acyl-sn-glycerol-3-phosphate acyltransferase [Bacteroides sp.]MCM1379702.1 1-acyl-sn-glycerol-3-phosphate acyltransferase [Bacteroides sp.]MCM1446057.1 1-acyl-sn-glycerol-3-phosphate acyltransferase [Prevotella sp.]